ncbi:MAG: GTP-binding protein [Armatimonadota bacterium]
MAVVNNATHEITCKLVYYGPGMCGKTSNLQYLYRNPVGNTRGEIVSLATPGERTLYFDFLPINIADIDGMKVKFALYTVPGQVMYDATRKLVLRGADGVVFVADSQWDLMDENVESWENMVKNMKEHGLDINEVPYILQYNKRDLPAVAPRWYLEYLLNPNGVPAFDAVAIDGTGVYDTLYALCRYVIRNLVTRLKTGEF